MSWWRDLAPLERRILALLVTVALCLRIGVAVEYAHRHPLADRPPIDEAAYERWALSIADGDWMGKEVFFQEPLYPYWLGIIYACFDDRAPGTEVATPLQRTAARHTQAFLGAGLVVLVYLLTRRVFGPAAAIFASALAALERPLLAFPAFLLKPNLFLPLLASLALAALVARTRRAWFGVGVLAGLCALLRGNVLVLLPCLAGWPLLRAARWPRRIAGSCAFLAGAALVLAPVAWRNHRVGGEWVLTTTGAGTNFYVGNNLENPHGIATELDFERGIPEHELDDFRREAERRTGRTLTPSGVSAYWLAQAFASMRAEPLAHLWILARKLRLCLSRSEAPDNHHLDWDARYVSSLALPWPGFGVLGTLGIAGLVLLALGGRFGAPRPREPRAARELALFFALYLATIVLTVVSMRVRLALVVLLLPFAGWCAAAMCARLPLIGTWLQRADETAGLSRFPPAGLCALALALGLVFTPAYPDDERREDLAERDFNLAVYELEAGRIEDARALADALEDEGLGSARLEILRAELDYRAALELGRATSEDRGARLVHLDRALERLRPIATSRSSAARDRYQACALAGYVQLEAEKAAAAERSLRAARDFDPDDRRLRLALANSLFLQAVDAAPSPEGRKRLLECEELLAGLISEQSEPSLEQRLAEVRSELGL